MNPWPEIFITQWNEKNLLTCNRWQTGASAPMGLTVLGKIPAVLNLPRQWLEKWGPDLSVEIVPRGRVSWGSVRRSPPTINSAWGNAPPASCLPVSTGVWGSRPGAAPTVNSVNGGGGAWWASGSVSRSTSGGNGTRLSSGGSIGLAQQQLPSTAISNAWGARLVTENQEISKEEEASTSGSEASSCGFEGMDDIEVEKGYKMSRVCDKLIDVFLVEKTKPEEWRILLAFSDEWVKIKPYFYRRCKAQAKLAADPKRTGDLLKLARRMKEVDDDMMRHNEFLATIEKSPLELDTIVARHRKDFTGDFFRHLHLLCESSYDDADRRDEIASIASKCLAAVEAHDSAMEDSEALSTAQLKFDDILSSPSLEAAAKKIDTLAKNRELDSTLMLLITKAWAAAKESTMMKEEVKDIMFHLYNVARGNMSRLVPKEVRIIRHLLSIEDPRESFAELTNAFSPGDELEGKDIDSLYTTPEKLHQWIQLVLDAFHSNKKGTLIKEAQNLMKPSVIGRLEILKEVLEDQFL